jgi:hypothetical protein
MDTWASWWPIRLPLLVSTLTVPLAGPSPDPEALAMALAAQPLPEVVDSGWREGMLLHLLLGQLGPAERDQHQLLLGLGYELVVTAVAELTNRLANAERAAEAQQALAEAFDRLYPEVGGGYASPRDAEILLGRAYADWPVAAEEIVQIFAADEMSDMGRQLAFERQRANRKAARKARKAARVASPKPARATMPRRVRRTDRSARSYAPITQFASPWAHRVRASEVNRCWNRRFLPALRSRAILASSRGLCRGHARRSASVVS